jgi:hypothetical protein
MKLMNFSLMAQKYPFKGLVITLSKKSFSLVKFYKENTLKKTYFIKYLPRKKRLVLSQTKPGKNHDYALFKELNP